MVTSIRRRSRPDDLHTTPAPRLRAFTPGRAARAPRPKAPDAIATVEDFLRNFPNLSIVPVDYAVAREAARIRALTGLRTADALEMATAGVSDAGVLVGDNPQSNGMSPVLLALYAGALLISLALIWRRRTAFR